MKHKPSDRFRRRDDDKGKRRVRDADVDAVRSTVGRPKGAEKAKKRRHEEDEETRKPRLQVPNIVLSEQVQLFLSSDLVIPDGVGACSDLLYQIREQRLELNRHVAVLAEKEAALTNHIVHSLPLSDATGVRGRISQVSVTPKEVATAKDWNKIYKYVRKNNAWDLLQHRLNDSAVAARWENGEKIPGITKFVFPKLSCTKLGGRK